MVNGDGNEICKIISSLISNKKTTLHVQHTFCTVLGRCFARPQRETFQYTFYGKINVVCAHQRFFWLCFCSLFFFSLPLIFTLKLLLADRYHFSFSHQQYMQLHVQNFRCFSNKIRLLCFLYLALDLSLLFQSASILKLSRKKTRLC